MLVYFKVVCCFFFGGETVGALSVYVGHVDVMPEDSVLLRLRYVFISLLV